MCISDSKGRIFIKECRMKDLNKDVGDNCVAIKVEGDVARAVYAAQDLLQRMGFDKASRFMVATAVSELARNIYLYAGSGVIILRCRSVEGRYCFEIVAEDEGPGIQDIEQALSDGFSTGGTLGLGLPGARRLMDELSFDSARLVGTRVVARKWL